MVGDPPSQLNDRGEWHLDAGRLVDLAIDSIGLGHLISIKLNYFRIERKNRTQNRTNSCHTHS